MMDLMEKDRPYFEWLSFFSAQSKAEVKQAVGTKHLNSLASLLPKYTRFECHRYRGVRPEQRMSHVLGVETQRMVVVELKDQNGGHHAAGVDCTNDPKVIWDCQEKHGLVLSKKNLDCCCGLQSECVAIMNIASIVKKRGKK